MIASMLMSRVDLKPYTRTLYHNSELKSLSRYRFDKVSERAKLKSSVARLVNILFPELEKLVPTLHGKSVYALLSEFPSAHHVAEAHLTKLTNLLYEASKGHYGRDKAVKIREAARSSIGSVMPSQSLELRHTIKLINELTEQINETEAEIQKLVDASGTTLMTIPGISYTTAMLTWRNEAPNTCDLLYTTPQNMSVYGTAPFQRILPKSVQRGSIIMLLYPMPQKNSLDLFLLLRNLTSLIHQQLN